MMKKSLLALLILAGALLSRTGTAAPNDAFLDPEKAGPDYQVQGEYVGQSGDEKLGAQLIAQGNGAFQAVFLPGGLPGDGWDGKTRVRVPGKSNGSAAEFPDNPTGWSGTLAGGTLTGQAGNPLAGKHFELHRVVRHSATEGLKAPAGAKVLFDGTNADAWENGKMSADGLLQCGSRTKDSFKDFTLHLEFRTPFKPEAKGQSRGNSGVYIFNRYELQILDSFGLNGVANECGAVYTQKAPLVNMCYPPLTWQTYDVEFQAARYDGATKTKNAVLTMKHNGVVVHDHYEVTGPTGGGKALGENGDGGPLLIQNHSNPVYLKNVWIVER
jgi:hypothetical protein